MRSPNEARYKSFYPRLLLLLNGSVFEMYHLISILVRVIDDISLSNFSGLSTLARLELSWKILQSYLKGHLELPSYLLETSIRILELL